MCIRDRAVCSRKAGEAHKQTVDFDEMMAKSNSGNLDIDENFYGDQDFDMEDFDPEGFDIDVYKRQEIPMSKEIEYIISLIENSQRGIIR